MQQQQTAQKNLRLRPKPLSPDSVIAAMSKAQAREIVRQIPGSPNVGEWLPVASLKVDYPRAQRNLRERWVTAHKDKFDPN